MDRAVPVPVQGLPGVVSVSAGLGHTCAVTADDTLWCWGDDRFGPLGREGAIEPLPPAPVPGWP